MYSCIVRALFVSSVFVIPAAVFAAPEATQEFSESIRPVLHQNCAACHNPSNPANRTNFLSAQTAKDVETKRGLWANVAVQLRNRTMPPVASKLTEEDRLRIATWIETRLRDTACSTGEFAGAVAPRRLNRREYHHTIRDLLGVDLAVADIFPADESGGAGFDTNGETLYIPPMMLERYMEAAQAILDRVIVTPRLSRTFPSAEMQPPIPSPRPGRPLEPSQEVSADVTIFVDGQYNLRVSLERPKQTPLQVEVKVDGTSVGKLNYPADSNGGATARAQVANLDRGVHKITVVTGEQPILLYSLSVEQRQAEPPAEKAALHYRLFGMEPSEAPLEPRTGARRVLEKFLRKAYRRPVEPAETERFLALYDRAAERGDPYEESIKLALKGVLVSSPLLFRIEERSTGPVIRQLGQYDMASRLSYFLWSTLPDEELFRLAEQGRLQDPEILSRQVDRMLDDPQSRAFAGAFVGQWLGTQDIGGRAVPLLTELQHYYTPEVAAELRQEPVMLFHHLLTENRSLLELLTSNYTFMTARLAKFYQVEDKVNRLSDGFQRVEWPDDRRAGVLGMASVLAMTSHYRQSSPVLRGAWVLDTLLGTAVPPPPPDVPPLEKAAKSEKGLSIKEILSRHRSDPSCTTCHHLMDPIGFGLENFDWMGRWRDEDQSGRPVDASGTLPSGERFNGPVELRQVLVNRKSDFLRHLSGKLLGFALGRGLQDGDQCTVQRLTDTLERDGYRARTLIREIVLSTPFRNTQGGVEGVVSGRPQPKRSTRRLLGDK
jgi:cytochrome c553